MVNKIYNFNGISIDEANRLIIEANKQLQEEYNDPIFQVKLAEKRKIREDEPAEDDGIEESNDDEDQDDTEFETPDIADLPFKLNNEDE